MCVEECSKRKLATDQQEGEGNATLLSKAWESITPTKRATPKRGSPSLLDHYHLVGPYRIGYTIKCTICERKRPKKENVAIDKRKSDVGGGGGRYVENVCMYAALFRLYSGIITQTEWTLHRSGTVVYLCVKSLERLHRLATSNRKRMGSLPHHSLAQLPYKRHHALVLGHCLRTWGGGGGLEAWGPGKPHRPAEPPTSQLFMKSPPRQVVRSSVGTGVIYPPILGSSTQHIPMYDIGCLAPCKTIHLGDKMIPQ